MSWDKGFNFRGTSGFVTDTGNNTYVLNDAYPTTRNGVTFGWLTAVTPLDRNAAGGERLAGINYGVSNTFQIDLPSAGDYRLTLALGDFGTGQICKMIFKDSSTTLATIGPANTGGGQQWFDATAVNRGPASDWVSNNVPIDKTFATSTLNCVNGDGSNNSTVAHIFVSQLSVAGGTPDLNVGYNPAAALQ